MGDSPEIRLLISGGIGLDPKILQHRPQHDIHFGDREISADAPPCSATNASHAGAARPCAVAEAIRIESFGVGEDFRILVHIGNTHDTVRSYGIRHSPRSKSGELTRRPNTSMTVRTRSTSKIVARRKSLPPRQPL